jgi:hypothetical protein
MVQMPKNIKIKALKKVFFFMSAKHYQVVDDIKVSEFQYVPLYRVANADHGFFGIIFIFLGRLRHKQQWLHMKWTGFHL